MRPFESKVVSLASAAGPAFERLWLLADGHVKRLLILAFLLVLGSSVAIGLAPMLLKLVIDGLEHSWAQTTSEALFLLAIAYALLHWLGRALGELRGMLSGRAEQRIQRLLSNSLFEHIMSLPLSFHLERKTGALSQTLTNGLLGYRILLQHVLLTVLPLLIQLTTISVVLLALNHVVFLAIVGVSVLCYLLAFWAGAKRIGHPARAASNAHIDAGAVLTDSILNYETVKYFSAEANVHDRFADALVETERQWSDLFMRKMENGLIIATIFALSLGVSVCFAAYQVKRGYMSIGEFVLVNTYMLQIAGPLQMIGFAFRDIAQGLGFIEKMTDLFGERREPEDSERSAVVPNGQPYLVFEDVSYSYSRGHRVLIDVSFSIPSGKSVAIVGASGSGKSSLIRLLTRLVEPDKGRICLNGTPLSNIRVADLRKAIAVVPQDIALFNDSIAYNIGFGRPKCSEAAIIKAARVAHIHDFIVGLPMGYETVVGERGLKLSGGQKQRLAIARAVIRDPRIFVFDEATASLDSGTEQAILHDLKRIARATTTLIIAHRLSTIAHADEIVVLDRGRVVERGTHGELMESGGAYAVMWRAQHSSSEPRVDCA